MREQDAACELRRRHIVLTAESEPRLEQPLGRIRNRVDERLLVERERAVVEESVGGLLAERPVEMTHGRLLEAPLAGGLAQLGQGPGRPRVVDVDGIPVLEAAPGTITVLQGGQPGASPTGRRQEPEIAGRLVGRQQAEDDLARVEDDRRMGAVDEVAGETAVGVLNRQFPFRHRERSLLVIEPTDHGRVRQQRRDDVARHLRIGGQPPVLERVAAGHAMVSSGRLGSQNPLGGLVEVA